MEKPFIKLNDLSPIMNSLIEKIQLLDSDIFTKQQKLTCTKEMLEVVDSLRKFFGKATDSSHFEHNKIFVEKIERAFSQFEWNTSVAVSPLEFDKFSENGKLLISSLLKLLGSKGCGLLIIETYAILCLKTICEMREKVDYKNLSLDKSNFKLLLDGFSSAANMLKKYWHIAFTFDQKNTIMLCLHQICNILPYLLKMIELKNSDLKKYLLSLLEKCLTRILSEIHVDGKFLKSKTCEQNFIMMMDFSLYKLNELSSCMNDLPSFIGRANTEVASLKPIIDEILCSVMSIAQVTTFKEDYYAVLTSSQKVLREFSELNKEIKEKNGCAIRLNANSVGESLCNLEQKVNNTVLKLVLEVFSNVNSPLKNILNKCKMDITKDNKASEDLNVLITEFDLEMDRIMQIGFFTISCTTSLKRKLGIQSCLASLESLETELIISLTALYVDCSAKNKTNFQWLFDFWLNEITRLKILIDSVLDPAGFCGVVKNLIKTLRLSFKEDTSFNSCLTTLNCNLKKAIRYSKKLIKTLRTNMEDEEDSKKTTNKYLTKFQLAVQECEAVLDLMENGQDTKKTINQALKRYDFLMLTLEKLSSHLFFLVADEEYICNEEESFPHESSFPNFKIPQRNYYKLCESSDITFTHETVPEILTPYLNKGILRSKRRNVLYRTPVQVEEDEDDKTLPQTRYWDKTSASNKRSRCCKPLTLNLELENTVDLEMTTIFENISKLNDTFSMTLHGSPEVSVKAITREKEQSCSKDVACSTESYSDSLKPTYTSTGCCTKFHLKENKKKEEKEEYEDQKGLLGSQLRNRFLQTLKDLSHNDSLLAANDREASSYVVDSPDRINDLKKVEEKINFLKTRMPLEHN